MIADGGYRGTGLVIPHRRKPGQATLPNYRVEPSVLVTMGKLLAIPPTAV